MPGISGNNPAPTTLKLHRKSATLEVVFPAERFELSAEYLRVFSPSAEVRGHGKPQLQLNKANVTILNLQAQGNYAVKLSFSDGHNTGIYTWSYLRELGQNYTKNWSEYLQRVEAYRRDTSHFEALSEESQAVKWVDPKTDKITGK